MTVTPETQPTAANDKRRGNALGGRGGPEDELLIDGQEEVFSRTEVELGRIEHHTDTRTPPRHAGAFDTR